MRRETGQPRAAERLAGVNQLHRAVEWYALVTLAVVGLSHLLRPRDWVDVYARLHRLGNPGALINGALALVPGAAFVAAHPVWTGPGTVLTLFGWALVLKGALCLVAPAAGLRSMARAGVGNGRKFVAGGAVALALAGFVGYVLWVS